MPENKTNPKISVVVPCYNAEKYISKNIETLLSQTWSNIELIFIDDGSTDRTLEILRKYGSKHDNVKIFEQNHKGPGVARNYGASMANGEILVLVDADMYFEKDYVEKLTLLIRQGKTIGTTHTREEIANKDKIWSRCWTGEFMVRNRPGTKHGIFRAVLRSKFLEVGGFDVSKGRFDDTTLKAKLGNSIAADGAVAYHHNPEKLTILMKKMKWMGGSFLIYPERFSIYLRKYSKFLIGLILLPLLFFFIGWLSLPIFYLLIIFGLTFLRTMKERYWKYLWALPIYYFVFSISFVLGVAIQLPNFILSKLKGRSPSYRY